MKILGFYIARYLSSELHPLQKKKKKSSELHLVQKKSNELHSQFN
jgi:hypothetical protein